MHNFCPCTKKMYYKSTEDLFSVGVCGGGGLTQLQQVSYDLSKMHCRSLNLAARVIWSLTLKMHIYNLKFVN